MYKCHVFMFGKDRSFLVNKGLCRGGGDRVASLRRCYLREGDPGPQEADSGGDRCWWNKHKKKCTVLNFGKCYEKGVRSCVKAYTKERDVEMEKVLSEGGTEGDAVGGDRSRSRHSGV